MIAILNITSHLPRFLNGLEVEHISCHSQHEPATHVRYPLGFPISTSPNSDYYVNLAFTLANQAQKSDYEHVLKYKRSVLMRAAY